MKQNHLVIGAFRSEIAEFATKVGKPDLTSLADPTPLKLGTVQFENGRILALGSIDMPNPNELLNPRIATVSLVAENDGECDVSLVKFSVLKAMAFHCESVRVIGGKRFSHERFEDGFGTVETEGEDLVFSLFPPTTIASMNLDDLYRYPDRPKANPGLKYA